MRELERPIQAFVRRGKGRPAIVLNRADVVRALRAAKGSQREAAKKLNVSRATLGRYLAREPVSALALQYDAGMRQTHYELLAASGISPEVAKARGYSTSSKGLDIPLWRADGTKAWVQTRLDAPVAQNKRYKNPRDTLNEIGARPVVDVSPAGRAWVLDPKRRLYVTESPRKADAAVSKGMACVAMAGCEMLCLEREQWAGIDVERRNVVIVFDADGAMNPRVADAEQRLRRFLERTLQADVRVVRLPPIAGPKTGLDDYLTAGHTEADLMRLPLAREPDDLGGPKISISGHLV